MFRDGTEVKNISGFPTHVVSKVGKIYSKSRQDSLGRNRKGKELREYNNGSVYPHVWICCDGERFLLKISRLVLTTFVGPCPDGMECRHMDGNPKNNRLDNLCWGTHRENIQDRTRAGTTACGERQGRSVLKEQDVHIIRYLDKTRLFRYEDLAFQFGVSISTIWQVVKGITWNHLKPI